MSIHIGKALQSVCDKTYYLLQFVFIDFEVDCKIYSRKFTVYLNYVLESARFLHDHREGCVCLLVAYSGLALRKGNK